MTQYPQGPSYPPPAGSGPTGQTPGAPKMANRHLVAVLVVLLVAGGIGTFFAATSGKTKSSHKDGSGGSPAAVAANFYAAMNAHNLAAMQKLACAGGSVSGLQPILGNASAAKSLSDPVVSGSTATGKGTVTFKTGGLSVPLTFTMTFTKQGDGWCVQDATPQFPNLPTGSTSASTSPPSSPTSAPAVTGTCRVPAGATSAPSVVPPSLLKGGLDEKTLTTPADKWKYSSGGVSLSSYCFNGVTQSDLGPFLAYCDGAGWTASPGDAKNQLQLTRTDSLTPKNVLITAGGTLKLDRNNFDANSGSLVISWY